MGGEGGRGGGGSCGCYGGFISEAVQFSGLNISFCLSLSLFFTFIADIFFS